MDSQMQMESGSSWTGNSSTGRVLKEPPRPKRHGPQTYAETYAGVYVGKDEEGAIWIAFPQR